MSKSEQDKEFVAYIVELMHKVGPVSAKAMFGGHGIYLDGLMFALIADGVLYLKADAENEADFSARGLPAFTYLKSGKQFSLRYFQIAEEALEDNDEMARWANRAYAAALRAAASKRK